MSLITYDRKENKEEIENSSLLNHTEYEIHEFILQKKTKDDVAEYKISLSFRE